MSTPQVSVVIPAYNHRAYILDTLDSVFRQTYQDYEVIVVNDGSPDDTAEVLRPLAAAGRIRYYEQPNAGQATARNRGVELARGEYIAFLDDDDLLLPDKLEWQVACLDRYPLASAVGGGCLHSVEAPEPPDPGYEYQITDPARFAAGPKFTSPGQLLFRRAALRSVGGFDPDLCGVEDWDLYIRLAEVGPLVVVGRVGLRYRWHAANASNNVAGQHAQARRLLAKHSRSAFGTLAIRRLARRAIREVTSTNYLRQAGRRKAAGDWPGWAVSNLRAVWVNPSAAWFLTRVLVRKVTGRATSTELPAD